MPSASLHPRSIIRKAVLDRLLGEDGKGVTAAGIRVFASRRAPVDVNDPEELPAILIYSRDEKRDPLKDYGPEGEETWQRAELRIVVECLVKGGNDLDDDLDAIALEVEAALDDWDIPGFEGALVRLGDSDIDVVQEGLKYPVGAIGLVFHVFYERDWRLRPPGTRPTTVDARINGGAPERIITNDRGIYQAQPETDADFEDFLRFEGALSAQPGR